MEPRKLLVFCAVIVGCCCYDFRLPNDTQPVKYDLKIVPNFGNSTFSGIVNITINVITPTRHIVLHARNLTIDDNIQVISDDELLPGSEDVNSTETDLTNSLFIISTVEELSIQRYVVIIKYSGIMQEEMAGFSVASYSFNGSSRYIGVTHFEPTHARSVYPCYDEPRYRTNFTVEFLVPSSYGVISNVLVDNNSTVSNGLQSYFFQGYRPMPTYLLAWVIYDTESYFNVSSEVSGVQINTWARQEMLNQAAYANSNSGTILTTLWRYLNTPYVGNKLDQAAIPNFFLAAKENWGLITYTEESLLYKTGVSTTRDLQSITVMMAHELTHQWFGDLVTVESWNYPWLKEAFSQYFQYYAIDMIQPSWQLTDQIVVDLIQPAMEYDSNSRHALNNYNLSSEKEISEMFDVISYNKGAAIVRMLQNVMGEEAFRLGLQIHFKYSQNGVTNPEKFWKNMRTAANNKKVNLGGGTLDKVMSGWTDNPGHPVLSVVKGSDGRYNITQKRFLYNGSEESSWWIPLTYITQSTKDVTKLFLPDNSVIIANISTKGWILFNVNQTGFYRVNYDSENWQLLRTQLHSDLTQIPSLSRAQLLDDVFKFARAGLVSYTDALSFTTFLKNEVDYIPWLAALRNFNFLLIRFYNYPSYKILQDYLLNLMKTVIADVGFQESATEGHVQKLKRALILEDACTLGHPTCVAHATNFLQNWKKGISSFSADVQNALLCTGVEQGSSDDWDFVFSQYLSSPVPTQKASILSALMCSRNATKINQFLDSVITNTSVVSSKEFADLMKTLSSRPAGASILLHYLVNSNYSCNRSLSLPSDYEEEVLLGILSQLMPQISSRDDILKLSVYALNGSCLSNETAHLVETIVTEGYRTIEWQEQYHSHVHSWLSAQQTAPDDTVASIGVKPTQSVMSGQSQITAQISLICIFIMSIFYVI